MDLDSVMDYLSTPGGAYAVAGASALVSLTLGYLFGKKSGDRAEKERNYALEMEKLSIEREKINLETDKLDGDPIKLKEMTYQENARIYDREKEIDEIKRRRELEDLSREDELKTKDLTGRLALAKELSTTLAPVIQSYAEAIKSYHSRESRASPELLKARKDYRDSLIDDILSELEEDNQKSSDDYDLSEDDEERVERLTNIKYPLSEINEEPEMPEEIKSLLDLIDEEDD